MVFLLVLEDYSRPEHIRTLGQLRMGKILNVHFSGIRNIIVSASQRRKTSPWFCSSLFLVFLHIVPYVSQQSRQIKMRLTSRSRASGTLLAIAVKKAKYGVQVWSKPIVLRSLTKVKILDLESSQMQYLAAQNTIYRGYGRQTNNIRWRSNNF